MIESLVRKVYGIRLQTVKLYILSVNWAKRFIRGLFMWFCQNRWSCAFLVILCTFGDFSSKTVISAGAHRGHMPKSPFLHWNHQKIGALLVISVQKWWFRWAPTMGTQRNHWFWAEITKSAQNHQKRAGSPILAKPHEEASGNSEGFPRLDIKHSK